MRLMPDLLCAAAMLLPGLTLAQTAAPDPAEVENDAGYAAQFQCPETYPNVAARRAADVDFLQWAAATHPQWRVNDTLQYRMSLLKAKGCTMGTEEMAVIVVPPDDVR